MTWQTVWQIVILMLVGTLCAALLISMAKDKGKR